MTDRWADIAETHSAVVVFAGDRAYKFKKPVRFDFLDFSTRDARNLAIRRELELNRRLAPDVYLGVAEVTGPDDETCEPLLVMRRMPAARRLTTLVERRAKLEREVRSIARAIAAFHATAPTSSAIARSGSPDVVMDKLERDLTDLREFAGDVFETAALDEAAYRSRRYLSGRSRLLEARIASGWVRDGHGDLLADDIFCLDDGPRILDCLDFSDELRCGDVLADVAFLAMDLERLGAADLAAQLLTSYDEFSGEQHPASLADYYIAFRALIRAKVGAIRARQGVADARPTAAALVDLALAHLRRGRVALVVVGGAPGTGKSTLAAGIAARRGSVLLRSDVVRKELAGRRPEEPAGGPLGAGLYTDAATHATYAELLTRARIALELGETVVLDASWTRSEHRSAAVDAASSTAADLVQLRCDVAPAVADARVEHRRAHAVDASDADTVVAEALRRAAEPWPDATIVDTSGSPGAALERALAAVEARSFRS